MLVKKENQRFSHQIPFSLVKKYWIIIVVLGIVFVSGALVDKHRHLSKTVLSKVSDNTFKRATAKLECVRIDIEHSGMKEIAREQELTFRNVRDFSVYPIPACGLPWVPARITYKKKTVRADLRLKGNRGYYRSDDRKWSMRVRVKSGDSLFGMRTFSLNYPRAKTYVNEWYCEQLLRFSGVISKHLYFVDLSINGKRVGVYVLEEHLKTEESKNKQLRKWPAIQFNENAVLLNQRRADGNYLYVYRSEDVGALELRRTITGPHYLWDNLQENKLPAHRVLDVEKTAKLFALTDLVGTSHPISFHDVRFYYNPVTGLLEPIGSDVISIKERMTDVYDIKSLDFFGLADAAYDNKFNNAMTWERAVLEDKVIFRRYVQALEEIADKKFLDDFFDEIDRLAEEKLKILYRDYPGYTSSNFRRILYNNQEYIRYMLHPPKGLQAYFRGIDPKRNIVKLEVANVQGLPIEVMGVSDRDSVYFSPAEEVLLPGRVIGKPRAYPFYSIPKGKPLNYREVSFVMSDGWVWTKGVLPELEVEYRILGASEVRYERIHLRARRDENFTRNDFIRKPANVHEFEMLVKDESAKTIVFKPGRWTLERNLIIPRGYRVFADEGLELTLSNSAKVVSYSPLEFVGSDGKPIVIRSSDFSGQGIAVIKAGQESLLEYVHFDNLSNPYQDGWELTGAITFYESPVSIKHSRFSNSRSEDALNIIRSRFKIENTLFDGNSSDAFDADFSEGEIRDASFVDCGNDGIDISGSVVVVRNFFANRIGDKGISVGEHSQIRVDRAEIKNAEIAIAVKDLSEASIRDIHILESKVGFAVFQKKSEFGPASLAVTGLGMERVERPYLVEVGSSLTVDGRNIKTNRRGNK